MVSGTAALSPRISLADTADATIRSLAVMDFGLLSTDHAGGG